MGPGNEPTDIARVVRGHATYPLAYTPSFIMSDWEEECQSSAGYDPDINSSSGEHSRRSHHARGGKCI